MEHCLSQQAIHAKCFHPIGSFIEFKEAEIEQSLPDHFEQMLPSILNNSARDN
jgi:hypothetical protein